MMMMMMMVMYVDYGDGNGDDDDDVFIISIYSSYLCVFFFISLTGKSCHNDPSNLIAGTVLMMYYGTVLMMYYGTVLNCCSMLIVVFIVVYDI